MVNVQQYSVGKYFILNILKESKLILIEESRGVAASAFHPDNVCIRWNLNESDKWLD